MGIVHMKLKGGKMEENKEIISKIVHENPDSIEKGTPGKGGAIKCYGDFNNPEEFEKKLLNAERVRKFAEANILI